MNAIEDTIKHIDSVRVLLYKISEEIYKRGLHHDESKLQSPEREMYEIWRPKLDSMSVESKEYKDALAQMGEGLKHHYEANRHHPEHFPDGIAQMNLIDVVEMVCDWKAAASRKNEQVSMAWASKRFEISETDLLYHVIKNTLDIL